MRTLLLPGVLCVLLSSAAHAQWVDFNNETSTRLSGSPALSTADVEEKDYAWGDLDQDGDTDLVCVRKEPFTSRGRRPNVLFMNEGGTLVDRTTTLAAHSTVSGSQGFLDDTNDRDVQVVDLNGDGWLDVVTATTLSSSQPKYISHPRVYINRGTDAGGTWLGLTFDDENRIPTQTIEPRFCSVAVGDADGDGDLDLYFGDYDSSPPSEPARNGDLDDRLFINDGTGYFTDESVTRLTFQHRDSAFGAASEIVDMNGDGKNDIIKSTALTPPQHISITYNDTATEGFFGTYDVPYTRSPYHVTVGDLNNDGRPDFVVSDDGQDRFAINMGNDASGIATFQDFSFSYSGGGNDDGFSSNSVIADLDGDGNKDVLIADVDVDEVGCGRRTHIFRNLGNTPIPTLQEQRVNGEIAGLPESMLVGTHDIAVFDIDGDGLLDIVMGRCASTEVWINSPIPGLRFTYPQGLPAFLTPGVSNTFQVQVTAVNSGMPLSGSLVAYVGVNGALPSQASVTHLGSELYDVTFPSAPCGALLRYYFRAQDTNSTFFFDPPGVGAVYEAVSATSISTVFEDDMESGTNGWTVFNGPGLSTGGFELVDPVGSIFNGAMAAPENDADAIQTSTMCWVTENGSPGAQAGLTDVDGGPTQLISPTIDLSGTDATISFQRWFYSSGSDQMVVAVTNDGVNWVTVTSISGAQNAWAVTSFRVGNYVVPSATVQVRMSVSDDFPGSIVEAGIDTFRVDAFNCDFCQPDIGLQGPGNGQLSLCGGNLSAGTTADLKLTGGPASGLVFLAATDTLAPAAFAGGTIINANPTNLLQIPTDGNGEFIIPINGGNGPFTLYAQAGWFDPTVSGGFAISNAIQGNWLP